MLATVAPVVHARFEDLTGQEVPQLSEANLLPYVAMGLALWLYLVWERGWRWRAPPLLLCAAGVVVMAIWGANGLGALVMGAAVAAILYGAVRRG